MDEATGDATGDWVVGVDLGGTKIDVGLVSPGNRIVGRRRIPTEASEGAVRVVERIARCVADLADLLPSGQRVAALGICAPGPLDHVSGTLIEPPNLIELHNVPLGQLLTARLGIPIRLEHDAKAAALGEFHFGAGRGERSMVHIVVGTGVGGAIVVDGQLFRGPVNSAGEIGHVTLDRDGEPCSCGNRGCVETFVGGPWLARRYERGSATAPPAGEPITGERVVSLAAEGDALARRIMDEAGEALGAAIGTMAMVLNVDLFVIGGSVAKSGDLLLEPARRAVLDHCYRSVGCEVRIVSTELADDGPILGCAWLARQALGEACPVQPNARPEALSPAERAALEAVEGLVFDVQRFSIHDGAGLRTSVFLKGCPLRCPWCANPESQHPQPDLLLSAQRCIDCDLFPESCSIGWNEHGQTASGREKYGERVAACPTRALRWSGERRTAGEVIAEVLRDVPFYDSGGGLTLTGGEPAYQPQMAEALLRLAKAHGISTALETSGYTRWQTLERLLPYVDEVLFDLKHADGETHKAIIGVDNVLILSNLRRLAALHAPVKIRVPLIPGFNADEEALGAIARLVAGLDGLEKSICLLPYHTLGQSKYRALNRAYPWAGHERLADSEVQALRQVIEAYGLTVSIGG